MIPARPLASVAFPLTSSSGLTTTLRSSSSSPYAYDQLHPSLQLEATHGSSLLASKRLCTTSPTPPFLPNSSTFLLSSSHSFSSLANGLQLSNTFSSVTESAGTGRRGRAGWLTSVVESSGIECAGSARQTLQGGGEAVMGTRGAMLRCERKRG